MFSLKLITSRCAFQCQNGVCVTISRTQKSVPNKLILKDFRDHPISAISKKPRKPPFLKNVFLGNFDAEFLYYPEVGETERYQALQGILPSVEGFFSKEVDSNKINTDGSIPEDVISSLKNFGLFGSIIPLNYGGLAHTCTEYARICEEVATSPSIFLTLMVHQSLGANAIFRLGTEDQRVRYLPKLASGEWIASFCAAEHQAGMDYSTMKSFAELSDDGMYWTLDGVKTWVVNATKADVFIVCMPTEGSPEYAKLNNKLTTFIVEKSSPGISITTESVGAVKGVTFCDVKFDKVKVPSKNVLGRVGHGFNVCNSITNTDAYLYGSLTVGFLRKLLNETIQHVISSHQYHQDLSSLNSVKKIVATIARKIYAVESMTYLTTSILDKYEDPDVDLESVATKVYAIKVMKEGVQECLDLLGSKGLLESFPFEQMLRDSRVQPLFNLSLDFSDVYIAAVGLQHAGEPFQELVTKLRNPLSYPFAAFKLFQETQRSLRRDPKLTLKLHQYVHPSLKDASTQLERTVLRFKLCVLVALTKDGMNIMDNHLNLKRLSELAVLSYAMTAVISRASRSYCCGTQNHDHEMLLAESFVKDMCEAIDYVIGEILESPTQNTDETSVKIADNIFKFKGYAAEHPVQRNIT
nr:PREDICTED: acyl-CoA dehydrogenase family member 9, mitochondrial-like [Bemisia tabaci]